jgi:hypothetical protein
MNIVAPKIWALRMSLKHKTATLSTTAVTILSKINSFLDAVSPNKITLLLSSGKTTVRELAAQTLNVLTNSL